MHLIQVLRLGFSTEIMAWYFEDAHVMILLFKKMFFNCNLFRRKG